MLKEIYVDSAVTYEYPPDGATLPIIDPYDGCTIGCPYCFQLENENWNKNLIVKLNIAEILCEELIHWNKEDILYLGSKCDPYMNIDRKYQLTRKCLIELSKLNVKCMVTTKAGSKLIYRDIDIIKPMGDKFTLLLGLSNLEQLKRNDNYSLMSNIQTANELHRMGIKVWAFITPILPGITDVDLMINALDKDIPVFLDQVRLGKNNRPTIEKYIDTNYPHLASTYKDILNNNIDVYSDQMREKWSIDQRVKFVFE
ncbi:SPL family radical SAM protein [Paenibacillus tepidiphilus]|uniref:SPL family radical SAM protein n=1 Tax=Paenibacillus tepidiphilus TaxID=2608683 RepID=UPI0013A5B214|nr:radical SAM protein [Paenibacillus tepidiphilus]